MTGTFTPTAFVLVDSNGNIIGVYDDHFSGVYNGQQLYNSPGNIKVELSNDDGTTYREKAGYVTAWSLSSYQSIEPNFYYMDELTNDFYAVATPTSKGSGTYNCLAYAIDDYTQWHWPSNAGDYLSQDQVKAYMAGEGRTVGTIYENCETTWEPYKTKVIYYSGGHFAKVVSYTKEGEPLVIMSKWGSLELIRSDTYNAFEDGSYGEALYFIW